MPRVIDTRGISLELTKIIEDAMEMIVLVSPFVNMSNEMFNRLKEASSRGVSICLLFGKRRNQKGIERIRNELPEIDIFYHKDLHAKCFLNELSLIVSTMNLFEYSEKHNFELGIFLDRNEDEELFNQTISKITSVIESLPAEKSKHKIYINANNPWTQKEEFELKTMILQKKTYKEIAMKLLRKPNAIYMRVKKLNLN